MKSKCQWPDCGQKFEYDETLAEQKYTCPTCNRITYLIPQVDLKLSMFLAIKNFIISLWSIYFDTKSIKPDLSSPYKFVLAFARTIYIVIASWLLFFVVILLLHLQFTNTTINSSEITANGVSWLDYINSHFRLFVAFIIFNIWLFVYWWYKITSVIFDIAEYLRQIASK